MYHNLPRKFTFIGRPIETLPWWILVVHVINVETNIIAGVVFFPFMYWVVFFPFMYWDVYFDFLIYGKELED